MNDARPVRWPFFAVPAVALAAAVLLAIGPSLFQARPRSDVLAKGQAGVAFVVHRGETEWPVQTRATLRGGDVIQVRLGAAGARHAALFALGRGGRVQAIATSTPEGPGLPSLTLDASREPERLVLASSARPIVPEMLVAALSRLLAAAGGDPEKLERVSLDERLGVDRATLLVLKEQ
jgi:hypothetical protein